MAYTKEMEDRLRFLYGEASTDADRKDVIRKFGESNKVSPQSVISKLSSMGIYIKPCKTTKSGDPIVQKQAYVNSIRIMLGARDNELESLEKASKQDLKVIMERLVSLSEKVNLSSGR
jgi:hypothetical protein